MLAVQCFEKITSPVIGTGIYQEINQVEKRLWSFTVEMVGTGKRKFGSLEACCRLQRQTEINPREVVLAVNPCCLFEKFNGCLAVSRVQKNNAHRIHDRYIARVALIGS